MKINKLAIRDQLLVLEEKSLGYAQQHYQDYLQNARLNRSESIDDHDRSQAEQSGVLAKHFDCPIHAHEKMIGIIKTIDLGAKDVVEPGAVVRFNDRNFVISVASDAFECHGES